MSKYSITDPMMCYSTRTDHWLTFCNTNGQMGHLLNPIQLVT